AARNSMKWTRNTSFFSFMRHVWPQRLLLMLWVRNGRLMWSESVVETIVSHKAGVLAQSWVHLLLSKGHYCYRSRRTGERKGKSGLYCECQAKCSQLGHYKKGREGHSYCASLPKELAESTNFNFFKEDDVLQYVVRKPLHKESKKPRTKSTQDPASCNSTCPQQKHQHITLKKECTKKECANLLAKRMKAKEDCQKMEAIFFESFHV
ncbi:LOW QUALITY PROTEIN: 40S ribosomal protein S6, partial [Galemys pyrenaicus]